MITQMRLQGIPAGEVTPAGRYVRIEIPGVQKILSLAEVQVFSGGSNIATAGKASQSTTDFAGPPEYAIDGNTDGEYNKKSVTHSAISDNPWWELDLTRSAPVERVVLWNRTDNGTSERLNQFTITLLSESREVVWQKMVTEYPNPSAEFQPSGIRDIPLLTAVADYSQQGFPAEAVVSGKADPATGWAVGGSHQESHNLVLIPKDPISTAQLASLRLIVEQQSSFGSHVLDDFESI